MQIPELLRRLTISALAIAGLAASAPGVAAFSVPRGVEHADVRPDSHGSGEIACLRIVDGHFSSGVTAEFVAIYNACTWSTRDLTGWSLRDADGNTYLFPAGYKLSPAGTVRVYSTQGTDTSRTLYWGRTEQVWNDRAPEQASVVDPLGATKFRWSSFTDRTFTGAGDIAGEFTTDCGDTDDEATAKLLDGITGTIFTTGDNAYTAGTKWQFDNCYHPTWGRHRARTRPTPGNHDYSTSGASGYYGYFGALAGDPKKGWYSFDLGAWHIVALNSNCYAIGSCTATSAQVAWLKEDLRTHPARCTLAYWHHPRWSSGYHGSNPITDEFWKALYAARAELIVNGHDHAYERFRKQTPTGAYDSVRGIREIVVGSGGRSHYKRTTNAPNSEVHDSTSSGVLKLTLGTSSYSWSFVPISGATFKDAGTTACH